MLKLKNRIIDDDGNVIYNTQGIVDYMYKFKKVPSPVLYSEPEEIEKFNKYSEYFNEEVRLNPPSKILSHEERKKKWFYPQWYDDINLEVFFTALCKTDIEKERVKEELIEYKRTDMEQLLRFSIFLMDYIKKNNYVIGVGRGSSVNSYCLYLIGLHKVDSIKYQLNIKEFLK